VVHLKSTIKTSAKGIPFTEYEIDSKASQAISLTRLFEGG
jgi:hypothetical protein